MILKNNSLGMIGASHEPIIMIRPGINELKQAEWDKIKNDKWAMAMVEDGVLDVVSEDETDAHDVVLSLKQNEALSAVQACVDLELLSKLSSSETRPRVKKAIRVQIEKLEGSLKKDAEDPEHMVD